MRVRFTSQLLNIDYSLYFDSWDGFIKTCRELPYKTDSILVFINQTSPNEKLAVTGRWELPLLLPMEC